MWNVIIFKNRKKEGIIIAVYDWILGLGLIFGLAFFLMFLLKADMKSYFPLATLFSVFVVYAGLLDAWVMVILLIIDVIIVFFTLKNRGRGGEM